jgi:hypothetical protein
MTSAVKVTNACNYWESDPDEHHYENVEDWGLEGEGNPYLARPEKVRVRLRPRPQKSPIASRYIDDDPLRLSSEEVRNRFERDRTAWREKSKFMSSVTDIVNLPEYQRVIGLGTRVVPLIIEALRESREMWFPALIAIIGDDKAVGTETVDEAAERWIAWYRARVADDQ